jgi:HAE1 family hydrophobic/amphiphilic exporter-1
MTTFAMVFGMIPVAFGVGEGAETRAPMGIAVIGGLLTSLFLTLVVVPAAYDLFDDFQGLFKKRKKKDDGAGAMAASAAGKTSPDEKGGSKS